MPSIYRPDKDGTHRLAFESNRKKLLATSSICAICGQELDRSYKFPHPLSVVIDHIIPVSKGGHPSDLKNLQAVHNTCNRQKSNKIYETKKEETIANRVLPLTIDWKNYKY